VKRFLAGSLAAAFALAPRVASAQSPAGQPPSAAGSAPSPASPAAFSSPAAPSFPAPSSPPADAPPRDDITPPSPIDPPTVGYPSGAQGDATVVLELTIDAQGYVSDSRAIDGADPFAAAAVSAARLWTFVPALRAGKAVPARIHLQVDFHAPVAEAPETPETPATVAPHANQPPVVTPLDEVRVRGSRSEVGETKLSGAEVRQIPGAFGDAFRAMEALPGVTPLVSGLPFFFVRGSPPGNTGYFLDGVAVPLLFHLALGPSVIHPGLIDHVDFFPGGYPARFGRYAGGILDGETLPPATKVHAEGNIRVFDAGALAEAPMFDDRLTVLVAGRYSYTAALVQLIAKDTRVSYWDYQARVAYKLTPRDTLTVFSFGSFDEIDNRDRQSVEDSDGQSAETVSPFYPLFKTEFHRLDLRYDHDTANGHLRFAATLGIETSIAGSSQTQQTSVGAKSLRLRTEGEERLNASLKLRYGADVLLYHYAFDPGDRAMLDIQSLFPTRNDVMMGAYADTIWKVSDRVEIVPGIRADVYTSRLAPQGPEPPNSDMTKAIAGELSNSVAALGVDPRLATRVAASRRVTWVSTFGVSHQPPSFAVPVPGLTLGRLNSGLQTSFQASQGFEFALPLEITLTTTAFLHHYLGLSDATATCLGPGSDTSNIGADCLTKTVSGRSYGIELLARRDLTKRISGWVSYTLSRTTRETQGIIGGPSPSQIPIPLPDGIVPQKSGLVEIPSEFDRTHVLNVVGAVDLGAGWRAGARLLLYTGRPYSPEIHGIPVAPYDSLRLPTFYRIDVRLEKQWHAFGTGHISFVVEGMNVTLRKEAVDVTCQQNFALYDKCTPQYIGPVSVPSIGVEGAI
jgi:Gram-negative bacterial TonB protein C-terminal/TonB dependent receptor